MIEPVQKYLRYRKALGYQDIDLCRELPDFARFAANRGAIYLRNDDAIAWVSERGTLARRYRLLASIRRLGLFLYAEDERHEVIPEEQARPVRCVRRPTPYIYTDGEIRHLLAEIGSLPFRHRYDAETYKHLVGLIAATGLRISEARSIFTQDFVEDQILIRRGKFGKDRIVHIHMSTAKALRSYLSCRPRGLSDERLFVIHTSRSPSAQSIQAMFRQCTNNLNLTSRNGSSLPRIHDLRHTFAIRSLAACGTDRKDISNHIVALSTYMGHVSVASTYWYLEISTEKKEGMALAIEEVLDA